MDVKGVVRKLPLLGPVARYGSGLLRRLSFTSSKDYWEQRYQAGGNSGGGSLGHLAEYKATVLNAFVEEHAVKSVVEFGCGDGRQLGLARYPRYVGLDVSPTAIRECAWRFSRDPTKTFLLYSSKAFVDPLHVVQGELVLSLDVIYHLVEDDVFDAYMTHVFGAASRYVAIYSSDVDRRAAQPHVRHRKYSDWVRAHAPRARLLRHVENPHKGNDPANESFADFKIYQV